MKITALHLVQNYIVEPTGTAYKQLLHDKIMLDPLAKKLLNEQNIIIDKLQTLEPPDLTRIFEEIKTDFSAKKLDYVMQSLNTLKNNLLLGTITIALVSLAVVFYSIFSLKTITNNISTTEYNSLSDKSQKTVYIQKRWLDGYSAINLSKISDLLPSDEVYMELLRKNSESIVNLGYIGDLREYHSISNIGVSMLADDLLKTAENELLSGNKNATDIAVTIEQASIATHKVIGLDIDEEAQNE